MTTATAANGQTRPQPRKSLASQIDRLDRILDGLSEGIDDTVTSAVRQAARTATCEAVHAVVLELLGNPELRRLLRPTLADRVAETAREVGGLLARAGRWLARKAVAAARAVAVAVTQVAGRVVRATAAAAARVIRRTARFLFALRLRAALLATMTAKYRRSLLLAVAVGLLVGGGFYLAGPLVSSAANGLAGAVGALVAHVTRGGRPVRPA